MSKPFKTILPAGLILIPLIYICTDPYTYRSFGIGIRPGQVWRNYRPDPFARPAYYDWTIISYKDRHIQYVNEYGDTTSARASWLGLGKTELIKDVK